jgi:[ribosomal protein S18]-alanine N-acetyltransferase
LEDSLTCPFKIRRAEPQDLSGIAALEEAALPWATHWTPESYLCPPGGERWAYVAEGEHALAGFVLARWVGAEMEILNLAVGPTERRRGAGRALVARAIEEGAGRSAAQVFLEVRESNQAARQFYSRLGFAVCGRRPGYYQAPEEAAVLMARALPPHS